MNKVGKLGRSHVKGRVWERFLGLRDDAMVGQNGMGNHFHVPLGHVAARAVVRGLFVLP